MKEQSRREFVKKGVGVGIGLGLSVNAPKELFVHHVYFYLKNPDSMADHAKLLEGLNKLAKVPTIKLVHIGTPAPTNRSVIERSYSFSWLCFFNNLIEEEIYQTHPIHLKFIEEYSALWEKVIVYDSVGPKR
ncbi:Dabb family protein [Larkinella rosea]|uniref:Dabb family protein n=1 Tax=Larkinella rosea TaxID=2025312 RepID=A0A3P1C079_9BACT|nr:Dabb family protein [Larkinella rosea]RRB06672.1 Dabb family protein [Larkinella rosea]